MSAGGVRQACLSDREAWVRLRAALWPDGSLADHAEAGVIGFAEVSIRSYAEDWARSRGCTEFASDAEADNEDGARAHRSLGFADAGTVRCFRKDL